MITLSNINLKFDRVLVQNGNIMIPDNKITVITGKSGSGKTSLLYLIGLISSNTEYNYIFDKQCVNLSSDKEISQIRKSKIGYVFQENSLIENLTIADNLKYSAEIAGLAITEQDILNYLKQVSLDVDTKKYPRVLSGGERQRLAIACAMAKKPNLIIADEPTSALDEENSLLIVNILKKFSEEENNKVVIASHNPFVKKQADIIYEIQDEKIVLESGENEESDNKETNLKLSKTFGIVPSLRYAFKTMKHAKFQKTLMVIICAISIALVTGINGLGEGLVKYQTELLTQISDREIFLINQTSSSNILLYSDTDISISDDAAKKIGEISSIDSYYPYLEFHKFGPTWDNSPSSETGDFILSTNLGKKTFSSDTGDNNSGTGGIICAPYYNEENIDKRVFKEFSCKSDDKIYISYELADFFGLIDNQSSSAKISFSIGVPVVTSDTEIEYDLEDTTIKENGDIDCYAVTDFDLEIAGILDTDYLNTHSSYGNSIIYMPVQMMLNCVEKESSKIDLTAADASLKNKEWKPSAYVTFVNSYNDIEMTISKLETINPNFKAISRYQDIQSMNAMISNVKSTAFWIILLVLIIVFILTAIIYINDTIGRKYEYAVLKANGLNNKETVRIAISEAIIQLCGIMIISLIVSLLISFVINIIFGFDLLVISFRGLLIIAGVSLLSILIPTIVSIVVMNRVKPDRILRN